MHADKPEDEMDELPYIHICNISSVEKRTTVDLYRRLIKAQKDDKSFRACFDLIKKNKLSEAKVILDKSYSKIKEEINLEFLIDNGLICRKINNKIQVLVPRNEETIKAVMYNHHDTLLYGHLGRTRTYHKLREAYFWPGLPKDVKLYVNGCLQCKAHKLPKPNHNQFLLYPSLFKQPNSRIGIDLIGPFPTTERQNQYILTCIDYFTKLAVAVPIRDKTAPAVADALYNHWYCLYGIPYEIHSDQGGEFTGDIVQRLNIRLETDHRVTTPYNPSSNGEVERLNQTLKNALKIYA